MVSVRLVDLCKYFGSVKAVDGLNLEIKDGEFVVLLGPSGCGKTTTLFCIAGIYKPTKGRIYFDEIDVTDWPPKDRNIGMVFQSYALYPHMTVFDNIAFPLKLKKLPKQEIARRVREVAKMLQIDHLLDRYPAQLSGGQQQRVALARALVKQPDVFLLDEPLSNLDAKLRILMRAELKRLQKELKITTVYVTHDQAEAMTLADRIAVMNEGKLQQYGPPDEIYNRPANVFVAGFIGAPPMNLLDCSLVERDGRYVLDFTSFEIELPRELGEVVRSRASSSEVVFGVRPEDLKISKGPATSAIKGVVYVTEPLGREVIVNVRIGDHIIKVIESASTASEIAAGQEVWVVLDFNRVHIFDRKTGKLVV
ncbi:MAG: sugar ABC transporter ATP-binding protein [Thermoprotei archaeon]|nr:MAG: sugar ABC transporter ATP-binding protein [Thermoprotei archaeon]RLE56725.1 MAG: sugar ABC transporter ATP-binding protein [Thermoprotei archaeon]